MPYLPIMPKIVPDRIVIYPRDIANITGCSDRTARLILQRIRKINNKTVGQYVTIKEFCSYSGFTESEVTKFLEH